MLTRVRMFLVDGKWWKLRLKKTKKRWGSIEWDKHEMRVDPRARGKKLLGTLIHEHGHISMPWASEDFIAQYEEDLTNFLWDMGYRRTDEV